MQQKFHKWLAERNEKFNRQATPYDSPEELQQQSKTKELLSQAQQLLLQGKADDAFSIVTSIITSERDNYIARLLSQWRDGLEPYINRWSQNMGAIRPDQEVLTRFANALNIIKQDQE